MKKIFTIAILALLLCPVAHAQDKPQTADAARREKAVALLQSLATEVSSLQSAENRARIGANIADALWSHDEKAARAVFISIEDDIRLGLRPQDIRNPRRDSTFDVFMKLRSETATRIAKYDGELAINFLKTTVPDFDKVRPDLIVRERDFEVKLATQIVSSNPDLALKIGRQSLDLGFSPNLLLLLKKLHKKQREHGVTLYRDTVHALRDRDFSQSRGNLSFARSLAENLTPPLADEAAFRDFMGLWISAAVANGCGKTDAREESSFFCDNVRYLLPQMQQVAPQRAAQLNRLATEDKPPPWQITNSPYAELYQLLNEGDFDEALEFAKKYPDMEATVYWQTAMKAQAEGDIERARKIANDFTSRPDLRERLLAQLKDVEAANSVTDEELDQVQTQLAKIPGVEDQIGYLVDVAYRAGTKNRTAALKLMDRAIGLIETLPPGKMQMQNRLGLALLYCSQNSDRGLEMMESLLPKLNELIDAAAKLDGFDTHYLREGEWNMSAEGPVGQMLTTMSENAGHYAWTDFDRAVNLAAQFERPEIRMMAQTKLAQSILAGPPKRFSFPRKSVAIIE